LAWEITQLNEWLLMTEVKGCNGNCSNIILWRYGWTGP
jgi:hypothetical protein